MFTYVKIWAAYYFGSVALVFALGALELISTQAQLIPILFYFFGLNRALRKFAANEGRLPEKKERARITNTIYLLYLSSSAFLYSASLILLSQSSDVLLGRREIVTSLILFVFIMLIVYLFTLIAVRINLAVIRKREGIGTQ